MRHRDRFGTGLQSPGWTLVPRNWGTREATFGGSEDKIRTSYSYSQISWPQQVLV